jgi:hypothetical protein
VPASVNLKAGPAAPSFRKLRKLGQPQFLGCRRGKSKLTRPEQYCFVLHDVLFYIFQRTD